MAQRKKYLYKVIVDEWPEGSDQPDWQPDSWDSEEDTTRATWRGGVFWWPSRRHYQTKEAANKRAYLYELYGAKVHVERSHPIEWDTEYTNQDILSRRTVEQRLTEYAIETTQRIFEETS